MGCADLRKAAEIFKQKAAIVDKIIREAVKQGITKAKEIAEHVRAKIIEMAKNFKCTDVLSEDVCAKIKDIAAKLKVKMAEIEVVMKKLIAQGITEMKKIIEEIKKHFFPDFEDDVLTLKCEDVLSAKACAELRKAAEIFKQKAEIVDKITREAVKKGITKAKEIAAHVRAKLIEMSKNFKCTDVLSEPVCAEIKEVAGKLKVDMAKVLKVMKDLVAKGITKLKEIIEELKKHFFPHLL